MTTIRVETSLVCVVRDVMAERSRPPDQVLLFAPDDRSMGELTWSVDLSPAEVRTVEAITRSARMLSGMTPDAYDAVRSQVQGLRDLRQMGRNAFMALSAAERDRLMYDALTDVTVVLLAILRD